MEWLCGGAVMGLLLALAVGCAVLGFGISVEVAPRVLMVPGEGIVQAIAAADHHAPFHSQVSQYLCQGLHQFPAVDAQKLHGRPRRIGQGT